MATSFLAEVAYSDVPVGSASPSYTDILGKVTVKFGDVTCNVVDMPNVEERVVGAVPGSVRFEGYSLDIHDEGDNYADMVAMCAAGSVKLWRYTQGPATVGSRTDTFQGFITQVSGASGDNDTSNVFSATIKPTSSVTHGTVSA